MKLFARFCAAIFLAITVFISFADTASAYVPVENWSGSCNNAYVTSDGTLTAFCADMTGFYAPTSIDTNEFIGNINGTLMFGERNWSLSCGDASISNGTLTAVCADVTGSYAPTSIDTDAFIGNIDGTLMSNF